MYISLPHSLVAAGCCRVVQFIPTAPPFPPLLFPSIPPLRLQHSLRRSERRQRSVFDSAVTHTNRHRQANLHLSYPSQPLLLPSALHIPFQRPPCAWPAAEPCSEVAWQRKKKETWRDGEPQTRRFTSCCTHCRWLLSSHCGCLWTRELNLHNIESHHLSLRPGFTGRSPWARASSASVWLAAR
jgi:hypothetical protein